MIAATLDAGALAAGIVGKNRPRSIPGDVFRRWERGAYRLVVSEHVLMELARTLAKPYFRERIDLDQIQRMFRALRRRASMTALTTGVAGVATHWQDDLVLATAVSGTAAYLVTGDKELLDLSRFREVDIVTARQFLAVLDEEASDLR